MEYKHYNFNNIIDDKGSHEVHKDGCIYTPIAINRIYIGYKSSCHDAIETAKSLYPMYNFVGCHWCCKE